MTSVPGKMRLAPASAAGRMAAAHRSPAARTMTPVPGKIRLAPVSAAGRMAAGRRSPAAVTTTPGLARTRWAPEGAAARPGGLVAGMEGPGSGPRPAPTATADRTRIRPASASTAGPDTVGRFTNLRSGIVRCLLSAPSSRGWSAWHRCRERRPALDRIRNGRVGTSPPVNGRGEWDGARPRCRACHAGCARFAAGVAL